MLLLLRRSALTTGVLFGGTTTFRGANVFLSSASACAWFGRSRVSRGSAHERRRGNRDARLHGTPNNTASFSTSACWGRDSMAGEPILERFLRYVAIDTQSDEDASCTPSTAKQFDLARLLVKELGEMGAQDVSLSKECVVMATIPATPGIGADKMPVIGLIAHMDTSPSVSGKDVKPQLVDYEGGDIILGGDPAQIIRAADCPELERYVGKRIVTTDGTTLLGADDKAGVAAIMNAVQTWASEGHLWPHPKIRIAFTPDEEIGRGTENFSIVQFGAKYAYTIDGGAAGEVENETWCADLATVVFRGRNVHPGMAKGKMVNAVRAAGDFLQRLPHYEAPETTEKRQPFIHPDTVAGNVEEVTIKCYVRAFTMDELQRLNQKLRELALEVELLYPGGQVDVQIKEQYRNMVFKLNEVPGVTEAAVEAVRRSGLDPIILPIRGGTDGARLTEMGLPTPNLFAGGLEFHSRHEWIAVEALEQAGQTVLNLAKVWTEAR